MTWRCVICGCGLDEAQAQLEIQAALLLDDR
jgi:hypothetical protein